jgi:hypothetical protein
LLSESHCSIPKSYNLAKASDNNRNGLFEEPESDSDEEEDVFESLDNAIIDVLAPDLRLAAGVITHLYKLPAHLRAFVYGFARHNGDENHSPDFGYEFDAGPSISNPTQGLDGQALSKKKRKSASDDHLTEDVVQRRKSRAKSYTKSIVDKLKYACPFNIYDPRKYCVRNEKGGTGGHYLSCMGPGFTDPRHLKYVFLRKPQTFWLILTFVREHFGSTHRIHQCQRCWHTFNKPEELGYHRDKEEPRCEDRTHLIHEKEGITDIEWGKIETALAVPRARKGPKGKEVLRKPDSDRWFEVWKILFPPERYPNLLFPTHPCQSPSVTHPSNRPNMKTDYVNPEMLNSRLPTYSETERMIEIVKAIWDKKTEDASDGQYQPSQEDIFKMIREAASITNRSAQLPEHLTHPPATAHTKSVSFETGPTDEDNHLGDSSPFTGYDQTGEGLHDNDMLGSDYLGPVAPAGTFASDPYATRFDNDGFDWSIFDGSNPENVGHVAQLDYHSPDR